MAFTLRILSILSILDFFKFYAVQEERRKHIIRMVTPKGMTFTTAAVPPIMRNNLRGSKNPEGVFDYRRGYNPPIGNGVIK